MERADTTLKQAIQDINTAILRWYPFKSDADVIYIGEEDAVFSMLQEKFAERLRRCFFDGTKMVFEDGREKCAADYCVTIGYPERYKKIHDILKFAHECLKPDGRCIFGANNRYGVKYFCGDRDPYTEHNFDGIEDYWRAYRSPDDKFVGRCYSKKQLMGLLGAAGFSDNKIYSVYSDLENAAFLFAEGYIPNEELRIRIFPTYNSPATVFLDEEWLYTGLLENDMFHLMANAYLIESSLDGSHSDALQVTNSFDRGRKDAMITIIHENDTVTKEAAFDEGAKRLERLFVNMTGLKERGIPVVDSELKNGIYTMPLIKAESGMKYLERVLKEDSQLFLRRLDEFRDEILKSSDSIEDIYSEPIPEGETSEQRQKRLKRNKEPWEMEKMILLKKAMVDMIPLNSFWNGDRFEFYDQEYCIENYPLKAIMWRVIVCVHQGTPEQEKFLPRKEVFARYGIDAADQGRFGYISRIAGEWLVRLRKEELLRDYYLKHRKDYGVLAANRQRMNFSADEYQKLFVDIFEYADTRKLILFGTGMFARRFLALYGEDYKVCFAIDNNEKRWGDKLYPEGYAPQKSAKNREESSIAQSVYEGVNIESPEMLKDLRHGEYKIIICIKNYSSVMKQLDAMGITEYAIFDPSKAYPRKRHPLTEESAMSFDHSTVPESGGKKYHIGYIAGVFDLYHIGHLNMFRRAKEMCDYLIVGVVSDEGVLHNKRTEPFVPFKERIEMVRSCRYVDEAVEIPYMYGGTEEAWKMHHFDVQFSGSDYVNDPGFAQYKKFLEDHGATLEFFPYTQSTSSTKIKELIDRKLL